MLTRIRRVFDNPEPMQNPRSSRVSPSASGSKRGDNRGMNAAHPVTTLPALLPIGLAELGSEYAVPTPATPLHNLHWGAINDRYAATMGLTPTHFDDALLGVLGGNALWPNAPASVATVYSGHQFGVWAGQLGDGRALHLGQYPQAMGGLEIQLKGAGPTPFSRMGDGRAVLRSSMREYLCSEAMHGLGIPTSRALALVGASTPVRRESLETAAVVTRVAPSFLRFGHFEHFAHHGKPEQLRALFHDTVQRYFPALTTLDEQEKIVAWVKAVADRTASLMALWQSVGFCHGVMNTDNMSVLGLTIDYGPFQFLDSYIPNHICNHSDGQGRYAFNQQPQVGYWNCHALAQAMAVLMDNTADLATALSSYPDTFTAAYTDALRAKLGLTDAAPGDGELINDWMSLLAQDQVDHTIAWRALSDAVMEQPGAEQVPERLTRWFIQRDALTAWWSRFTQRAAMQPMDDLQSQGTRMLARNPKFVLRNHLAQAAITEAEGGNFAMVNDLKRVLDTPFDTHDAHADWAGLPPDWAKSIAISCSS